MRILWHYLRPLRWLVGLEQGTHAELLDQKGLYWAMWRQLIGERGPAPVTSAHAAPS